MLRILPKININKVNVMPALNFTVFIDKILSGEKRQTIRKKRRYPIKQGDKLFLYTGMRQKNCRKLGEAMCLKVIPISINLAALFEVGNETCFFVGHPGDMGNPWPTDWQLSLAKNDGFKSWDEFERFFIRGYKMTLGDSFEYDIIQWRDFKRV